MKFKARTRGLIGQGASFSSLESSAARNWRVLLEVRKGSRLNEAMNFLIRLGLGVFAGILSEQALAQAHCADKIPLTKNWFLQDSAAVAGTGAQVSSAGFDFPKTLPAQVPGTVLGAIVEQSSEDPFFGKNLLHLPGTTEAFKEGTNYSRVETPASSPFSRAWWYRIEFILDGCSQSSVDLNFLGITYGGEIWLNGKRLAQTPQTQGSLRSFRFDVTAELKKGARNVLAVLVSPPHPADLTGNWVDWNPTPQDKNMGLWRDVFLTRHGPVSLKNPFVTSQLQNKGKMALLTFESQLVNDSDLSQSGVLKIETEAFQFQRKWTLKPHEKKNWVLNSRDVPELRIQQPRLWWPHGMGKPELQTWNLKLLAGDQISDEQTFKFGVREVTSRLTADGARLFLINGKPLQIRGAGWASDLFLRPDVQRRKILFEQVRSLGLNTLRLEGQFQNPDFYNLADEMGILLMPGFVCCGSWQQVSPGETPTEDDVIWSEAQYPVAKASLESEILLLRSHPSVLVFVYGSDKAPPLRTEKMYLQVFQKLHWPNPILSSASNHTTDLTGPSGVKMNGPYDYTPPSYWFLDHAGNKACAASPNKACGGAWMFNTETSPGPSIPRLDSLKKFIPADHLWPIDDYWLYHTGNGLFHSLENFQAGLDRRYGPSHSLSDFLKKADLAGYDNHRAMFEAFLKNKYHSATGIIQWMLNSAWPSLIWHLTDYSLSPGSAFYGVKKANENLHLLYAPDDRSVVLINNTQSAEKSLQIQVRAFDAQMNLLFQRVFEKDSPEDSSVPVGQIPKPELTGDRKLYFVDLRLLDSHQTFLSENFYWLSTVEDRYDWEKTDFYHTPLLAESDLTELKDLPAARLTSSVDWDPSGTSGRVTLHNAGKTLAFFVDLEFVKSMNSKEPLWVDWNDNEISVMPGESRVVPFQILEKSSDQSTPQLQIKAWNS